MTETDAKAVALKETDYCYVLACAWEGKENDSICLERISMQSIGSLCSRKQLEKGYLVTRRNLEC